MTVKSITKSKQALSPEKADQLPELITFRRPKQARGVKKFDSIVDSAHELIISKGVENFSLYDIAEHAGVAVGSVYHFFPSVESVFAALVERYGDDFSQIVSEHIPPENVVTWGDIIWHHIEKSRNYINEHQQVLIMLLGPGRTWQTRQIDTVADTSVAIAMQENIEQYFSLPETPEPPELLHFAIRILESFWELSYQRHGEVTVEVQQETYRAMCAYLELYWPKYLALKQQNSNPD